MQSKCEEIISVTALDDSLAIPWLGGAPVAASPASPVRLAAEVDCVHPLGHPFTGNHELEEVHFVRHCGMTVSLPYRRRTRPGCMNGTVGGYILPALSQDLVSQAMI